MLTILCLIGAVLATATIVPQSAAASCPPFKLIGVRGSGEKEQDGAGYGRTVKSVVDWLGILRPAAEAEYINYQAIEIRWWDPKYYVQDYNRSVATGNASLTAHIRAFFSTCHDSKVVLAGDSQGAQVVADTYQDKLKTAEQAKVTAIVLFGDPRFNGGQGAPVNVGTYDPKLNGVAVQTWHRRVWQKSDYGKVRSYCLRGDPACSFSSVGNAAGCGISKGSCPHPHYADWDLTPNTTYTLAGARFIAQRAKTQVGNRHPCAPPSGSVSGTGGIFSLRASVVSCENARNVVRRYHAQRSVTGRDSQRVRDFDCAGVYSAGGEGLNVTCSRQDGARISWDAYIF